MIFRKTQVILGFAKAPGSDAHHFALAGKEWNTSKVVTLSERKVFLAKKARTLTSARRIPPVILSSATRPRESRPKMNMAGCPTYTGCPILAAFLFLRLGWETTNPNRNPSIRSVPWSFGPPIRMKIRDAFRRYSF
jgi:hypothetical protein